ncbi:TIGR02679 domain-containing protein [Cohnella fermenti]|uniref:DUF2399 domain-containing protein n=1 Tax=Cohnella fermenti TaxID=2565925 RepID=A0A4S4BH63_9BACL|nr:TIGR02679 domain-containing protein [Cohnella fermenti]THF73607.1 DUF2399 domain-containing protein [Cohnella fermenti]
MRLGEQNQTRAVRYFERDGFRRALEATWRKIRSLDRVGGEALVKKATTDECEAINAFFGWNYEAGETIRIPLAQFDSELWDSVFELDLLGLYELLHGAPLVTNKGRREEQAEGWQSFFSQVREADLGEWNSAVLRWLDELERGAGAGIRPLRECYKSDKEAARRELLIVVRTLQFLLAERSESPDWLSARLPIRMPVLAARTAGDAHALDAGTVAGRMLIAFMRSERGTAPGEAGTDEQGAEELETDEPEDLNQEAFEGLDTGSDTLRLRELYRSFGILDDDLSSLIHFYLPETGKPALPVVWTLRQTEAEPALPRCSTIFVVENPAVFSSILDSMPDDSTDRDRQTALLCTSGPASAAAIRWIQRCMEGSDEECRLLYSGDFDVKGLVMGHTLYRLFPDSFTPWRFDAASYEAIAAQAPVGPPFDEVERSRLEKMFVPWDTGLARSMLRTGYRIHQESLVSDLIADFRQLRTDPPGRRESGELEADSSQRRIF